MDPEAGERRRGRAAEVRFEVVDPLDERAVAAVRAYFRELDERFPTGFDPGEDAFGAAEAERLRAPLGAFVVGAVDGEVVACGGVQPLGGGVAEIKRMWVAPSWRGTGLGRRLLAELEGIAAGLGHRTVRLDTNGTLTAALALYGSAGYRPIGRYNANPHAEHWFEKAVGADRPGA